MKAGFSPARIAQNESVIVLADADAGERFAIRKRYKIAVVTLGNGGAGINERLDQVASGTNRANPRKIGTDQAAVLADAMARRTREFAEEKLVARVRVASFEEWFVGGEFSEAMFNGLGCGWAKARRSRACGSASTSRPWPSAGWPIMTTRTTNRCGRSWNGNAKPRTIGPPT